MCILMRHKNYALLMLDVWFLQDENVKKMCHLQLVFLALYIYRSHLNFVIVFNKRMRQNATLQSAKIELIIIFIHAINQLNCCAAVLFACFILFLCTDMPRRNDNIVWNWNDCCNDDHPTFCYSFWSISCSSFNHFELLTAFIVSKILSIYLRQGNWSFLLGDIIEVKRRGVEQVVN